MESSSKSSSKKNIYYAEQDKKMKAANLEAQATFKYFWRELFWERRRIIHAHDSAMVKIPFEQTVAGQTKPITEHMWIDSLNFDGEHIYGKLVNVPNQLTNVSKGDEVAKKVAEIDDWMLSILGKTYGGFTIQAMRSTMSDKEREAHDAAWGLDFGDYKEILVVYEQKENPENLVEHPMCKSMAEKVREFLTENPNEYLQDDEYGFNFLHHEAIAGNGANVETLLALGADKMKKTETGKTALDYAKAMGWEHVVAMLK